MAQIKITQVITRGGSEFGLGQTKNGVDFSLSRAQPAKDASSGSILNITKWPTEEVPRLLN
jgi:hypothetical protein